MIFAILDIFELVNSNAMFFYGSLSLFIAWFNIFYLMRMIKATSFFIKMIQEMIVDILPFLAIFFISILSFTNAFYVMDRATGKDITGGSYTAASTYMYLTALGEFGWGDMSIEHYDSNYEVYFSILFFLATVLVQIILLNLLIAIMGDTYDRVMEIAEEAYIRELCSLIAEYYKFFPEKEFTDNFCIQLIRVEEGESGDQNNWAGKLTHLKQHMDKKLDKLIKTN